MEGARVDRRDAIPSKPHWCTASARPDALPPGQSRADRSSARVAPTSLRGVCEFGVWGLGFGGGGFRGRYDSVYLIALTGSHGSGFEGLGFSELGFRVWRFGVSGV